MHGRIVGTGWLAKGFTITVWFDEGAVTARNATRIIQGSVSNPDVDVELPEGLLVTGDSEKPSAAGKVEAPPGAEPEPAAEPPPQEGPVETFENTDLARDDLTDAGDLSQTDEVRGMAAQADALAQEPDEINF